MLQFMVLHYLWWVKPRRSIKGCTSFGWFQFGLAIIVLIDVLRRFIYGSEPVSILMILIGD